MIEAIAIDWLLRAIVMLGGGIGVFVLVDYGIFCLTNKHLWPAELHGEANIQGVGAIALGAVLAVLVFLVLAFVIR
jgi:hypothetical protein